MTVTLPLRLETELAVGRSKLVRAGFRNRRRVLIRKPRADYGRPIKTHRASAVARRQPARRTRRRGVRAAQGSPVRRGARSRRFAPARPVGSGSRRSQGRIACCDSGTPALPTVQGATSVVVLRIRATSGIRVSRRNVVNGDEVIFRGRVRGHPIPSTGKLLQLQVFSRGHWLTFATPRANVRGRWRYRYRFTATRGVTRYRFRVRLPREAGYPFHPGTSRTVGVKVIGL